MFVPDWVRKLQLDPGSAAYRLAAITVGANELINLHEVLNQ